MSEQKRLVVDQITVICNGCKTERLFYPDRPLVGAEELIDWMKTKATACSCGAGTCDVKARLKEPIE
jgi:hypothetical protein